MNSIKIFLVLGLFFSCQTKQINAQTISKTESALDNKLQTLTVISALAGKGDIKLLHSAFSEGLEAGWTINELKETGVHIYAYAGFPRSLNTLSTLQTVVNERKEKGIKDELGREPTPLPANKSKLELGTELQTKLLGRAMRTSIADFAPIIDIFLKEHLFWDIFSRDNLDFRTREIITISTLAGLGNAEAQLRAHIGVSIYNGITEAQLSNWVSVIQSKVGIKEGNAANEVLKNVLSQRSNPDQTSTFIPDIYHKADTIFPKGEKIINNNFKGDAWLQQMIASDTLNPTQVGNVTFEPGARTNWHLHPGGQILLVTGGTGYYQEKGSPKRTIRKGDVIKCPPNIPHWHGASKDSEFIQIAITNTIKGSTVWMQPVTDEEYIGGK